MKIELQFAKHETRLAGFPYGQVTYQKQVKSIFDNRTTEEPIELVFPDQIEKVASSYVQGFFAEVINRYGYEKIHLLFIISSSNAKLKESIIKNIY